MNFSNIRTTEAAVYNFFKESLNKKDGEIKEYLSYFVKNPDFTKTIAMMAIYFEEKDKKSTLQNISFAFSSTDELHATCREIASDKKSKEAMTLSMKLFDLQNNDLEFIAVRFAVKSLINESKKSLSSFVYKNVD